jgi:hypothetical protein
MHNVFWFLFEKVKVKTVLYFLCCEKRKQEGEGKEKALTKQANLGVMLRFRRN